MPTRVMVVEDVELFPSDLATRIVEDDRRILREGKPIAVVEEFDGRVLSHT